MNVSPRTETIDGFETTIGINHLGHFLLTNLLLPTLIRSAPSRIVNVASRAHRYGEINRSDLMMSEGAAYNKWTAYCQSKLANVLFSRQLARLLHGTGVTSNSLHPGVIQTNLFRYHTILQYLFYPAYLFFKTPTAGAQTTLRLALDEQLIETSGRYFSDCAEQEESRWAQDDETAEWLWRKSEQLLGLDRISFNDEITKC